MANNSVGVMPRLLLRLFLIILTALFHHDIALHTPVSAAKISVKPLWDAGSNDTLPCYIEEIDAERGTVFLHGSEHRTCSIQINSTTTGSYARIEIHNENVLEESFILYMERQGHLVDCTYRYVVFSSNAELCRAVLLQDSIHLYLQGNVSVLVEGVAALDARPACPESIDDISLSTKVNQIPDCKRMKGYNQIYTCNLDHEGRCQPVFNSHCNTTIRHREVVFECIKNGVLQTQESMLIYPIESSTLDLSYNSIVQVAVDSFHYFKDRDLRELSLAENELTALHANVFFELSMLNRLDINGNKLTQLDVDLFQGLIRLTLLSLHENNLMTLPVGLFGGLPNLGLLWLDGNQLINLNSRTFIGLNRLTWMTLYNNNLVTLPGRLFGDLEFLMYLYLDENQLVSLRSSTFHGLGRLNYLSMENNNLKKLPDGLFSRLGNLVYLNLRRNELITLKAGTFHGLSLLNFLSLIDNNFSSLPDGLFLRLGNLSSLDLDGNQLITLNSRTFKGLDKLYSMDLQDNNLKSVPGTIFVWLKSLFRLNLAGNQLMTLNSSAFDGLDLLNDLYLDDNHLISLPSGLFAGLNNLTRLNLGGNQIVTLDSKIFDDDLISLSHGLFEGLGNLLILNLAGNQLVILTAETFHGLGGLYTLYLDGNNLISLPEGVFNGLVDLNQLTLHGNNLATLHSNTFEGLIWISVLQISDNNLTSIPDGLFGGLGHLDLLALNGNRFTTFNESTFYGLDRLTTLVLAENQLISLPARVFTKLGHLRELYLYENELVTVNPHLFTNLTDLTILSIEINKLINLPKEVFNGLMNLEYLFLESNQLEWLDADVFRELFSLRILFLHSNKLRNLNFEIFKDTLNIAIIDLSSNKLTECPNINHLNHLILLNLRNNTLTDITHDTFSNFTDVTSELALSVSQHEICECYVPAGVSCNAADDRSPYLTCDRLLSDRVLVVLMWLIGVNALCGNIFVLIWRYQNTEKYKVQDLLLSNLAMSDSLMGLYMVIVACADIYYGEYFPMQSETWRSGVTCRVAGSLSIASSELSVFFLTLISIDRCICIKFPFSTNKMGKISTIITSILIWVCSLVVGVVPSILSGRNFKFYDNSHVCIGLPLALTKVYSTTNNITEIDPENSNLWYNQETFYTELSSIENGLYFSTAVFLGLNCLCYLVILGCYIEILRVVAQSARQSGRTPDMKEQIRLTIKVTAIVATDFVCMFPIIVLGILVQARVVELPPSVYAWSVTFALPINSAINPYLYTIAEIISKYRKKITDKKQQQATTLPQSMPCSKSTQNM